MQKVLSRKKVGIITVHRLPNWGSVLQAYALQRVIAKLGYEVENIDYKFPNEFHWKRGKTWGKKQKTTLRKQARSVKNMFMYVFKIKAYPMMNLLNRFIKDNLYLSREYVNFDDLHKDPPIYDIYIAGSDQIWNPNTMLGDTSYMLDFVPNNAKKISYASSFSCLNIPEDMVDLYRKYLSRFSTLSVREYNGRTIIKEILGRDARVVLDPTLLLSRSVWGDLSFKAQKVNLPKRYILCYMIAYTFSADEPMSILLKRLQVSYGWPIIMLKNAPKDFDGEQFVLPRNYGIGIPEFLYLMQQSTIVVSSSFHGAAFALNMGKPLIALATENDDDRIATLVRNLGLADEVLVMASEVETKKLNPFYNERKEQNVLEILRDASMDYLSTSLK